MGKENAKTLLTASKLNFAFAGNLLLKPSTFSITEGEHIALLGINGSGKTTLLKIIAGMSKEYKGDIFRHGTVEYIPQLDLTIYRTEKKVYEFISEKYEKWWDVLLLLETKMNTQISESRILSSLSGGEIVKLNIAIGLCILPDLLLLDEPTNHLDSDSLEKLTRVLANYEGTFVIVSHNIEVLNLVASKIWEIDDKELKEYGGNYDLFVRQKSEFIISQKKELTLLEKKERKLKENVQKRVIKVQETQKKWDLKKKAHDRSTSRIILGGKADNAGTSLGIYQKESNDKLRDLKRGIAKREVVKRKSIHLDLDSTEGKGKIIAIFNGKLQFENEPELLTNINFGLRREDRVAILGRNGSGKTVFVKELGNILSDKPSILTGEITFPNPTEILYIDQKYSIVNPEQTALENMLVYNEEVTYEEARRALSNLGFHHELDIAKSAGKLSGGETARLAFAMASVSSIDILVLDEPTNNLDIQTVEWITSALKEYTGTIIAISHDRKFLENIGITNYFEIENKELKLREDKKEL
ncbi:MAG: ATP-binding cassette domain-containing protein [bacterium]